MSLSLHLLADRYVFESSPTRYDLGALHVPFDELTQPGQTEARLDAAVRRREPVALIGASGSGGRHRSWGSGCWCGSGRVLHDLAEDPL